MNGFINAQGFSKIGMLTTVIGAALNIILDPIFIFVFDMGVGGAALATIISQFVSTVWVLKFSLGKKAICGNHDRYQFRGVKQGIRFMAFQFTGQSIFTALKDSKHAVFFSLLRKAIIVVPLTLLLPRMGFGVHGVFLAEPISNAIGGLACFLTMWFKVYRKLPDEDEVTE